MNFGNPGRAACACGVSPSAASGGEPAATAQCRCRSAARAPFSAQRITADVDAADLTGTGFLRLRSFTADNAQPVPDVIVTISQRSGSGIPDKTVTTGPEALSGAIAVACPPRSYSLDEDNRTVLPYAVVDVTAQHDGYDPVYVTGVQIFDGEASLLELLMIPVEEDETAAYTLRSLPEYFEIPTHALFEGGDFSGPAPLSACRPRVLEQPIIPEKITVHLGRPSANVQTVTVSFRDYIKNVASSEVYPTWVGSPIPTKILGLKFPVNFNVSDIFRRIGGIYHHFFDQQAHKLPAQCFHLLNVVPILFQLFVLRVCIRGLPQRILQPRAPLFHMLHILQKSPVQLRELGRAYNAAALVQIKLLHGPAAALQLPLQAFQLALRFPALALCL